MIYEILLIGWVVLPLIVWSNLAIGSFYAVALVLMTAWVEGMH